MPRAIVMLADNSFCRCMAMHMHINAIRTEHMYAFNGMLQALDIHVLVVHVHCNFHTLAEL